MVRSGRTFPTVAPSTTTSAHMGDINESIDFREQKIEPAVAPESLDASSEVEGIDFGNDVSVTLKLI
ncbi:hypothetical protein SAMN06295987_1209 [Novosphingobium mathurense]|uniref:Uncharacterized protein n=2 Tax=Novosphingobium mathurense TaxID=428990 RepID=A0A1U6IX24_9SPHN|nr:hypothetical protein SAMN06295987_1209 [Novosphingobium mathurense]